MERITYKTTKIANGHSIFDKVWFLVLLIIPFLKPAMIGQQADNGIYMYKMLDLLFTIWIAISSLIVLFLFIKNNKITKVTIASSIYVLILFISTIVNGGSVKTLIISIMPMTVMVFLSELYIKRQNSINLIKALYYITAFLSIINFILMIFYPNGMYSDYRGWKENWLLGNYQQNLYTYLPAICFGSIYEYYCKGKVTILVKMLMCISMLSSVIVWSATTIVSLSVLFILLLLIEKFPNIITAGKLFIMSLTTSFLIIVAKIQNVFAFIIVNILKKNLDFSSRSMIWDKSLQFFLKKPLFGTGINVGEIVESQITKRTSHNQYLDILFSGGIALFLTFCYLLIISFKSLRKYKEEFASKIIVCILGSYFIMFITEARRNQSLFFVIITFAYHVKMVTDQLKSITYVSNY